MVVSYIYIYISRTRSHSVRGCLADVEVRAFAEAEMVVQNTPTCFAGKQTDTFQTGPGFPFFEVAIRSTSAVKKRVR